MQPAVVSIMEFPGDPDELMTKMEQIDSVAERKAPEYGGISSTVVRTENGLMIINLWSDKEGRHRMGDDPEIQQALRDSGFPPPSAKGYDVISHRTAKTGATV